MTISSINIGDKVTFSLFGRTYEGAVKANLGVFAEIDVGGKTIRARVTTLTKI